jgi:hypothetical protein
MARLVRDSDGEGYFGSRVEAWDRSGGELKFMGNEPMIGYCLLVGTMTAGSYSSRDWWRTTEITEFLEEDDEKLRFKTISGSTYTLYKS